jgi:hypothetical protein
MTARSSHEPARIAAAMPAGTPKAIASATAATASSSVAGTRSATTASAGRSNAKERPKSPRATCPT